MENSEESLQKAINFHQTGDLDSAALLYNLILKDDPVNLDALFLLGTLSLQKNEYKIATVLLKKAISINPNHADLHYNLGLAYKELKQHEESVYCFNKAISLEPDFFLAFNCLGLVYSVLGKKSKAIECFQHVLNIKPDFVEAYNNLGNTYREIQQLNEAAKHFTRAIKYKPDYMEAYYNLGITLYELKQYDQAIICYKEAIKIKPNHSESYNNLGVVLLEVNKREEAASMFRSAIMFNSNHIEAYYNLGNIMWGKCQYEDAISNYTKAIENAPDHVEARWNRALLLLLIGNYKFGWAEYEVRFKRKATLPQIFDKPIWDGSDLTGRTIFIYSEQGFGDTFQFVRFLPLVKAKGGRVIFGCKKSILSLLVRCEGIDEIVGLDDDYKPNFDTYIALLSLPGLFNITLENLPSKRPYIFPRIEEINSWHKRLIQYKVAKVGIVWSGNTIFEYNSGRSCSLSTFKPVAQVPNVVLFSLQKGTPAKEAENPEDDMFIVNLDKDQSCFGDTAAIIANLDLVISVDTGVVHLAGALGKPVWVIISHLGDWRYLLNRDDSPWYPTMRIFRLTESGDWDGVMQRIASKLDGLVNKGLKVPG